MTTVDYKLRVAGMDTASVRWHCAVYDGDEFELHSCTPNLKDTEMNRMALFRGARGLSMQLEQHPGLFLFIEEPLMLRTNWNTTLSLSLAAGAIWSAFYDADLVVSWAAISSWKKDIIGKGNASKELIRLWGQRMLPDEVVARCEAEPDYYDACAIAIHGYRRVTAKVPA